MGNLSFSYLFVGVFQASNHYFVLSGTILKVCIVMSSAEVYSRGRMFFKEAVFVLFTRQSFQKNQIAVDTGYKEVEGGERFLLSYIQAFLYLRRFTSDLRTFWGDIFLITKVWIGILTSFVAGHTGERERHREADRDFGNRQQCEWQNL